MDTITTKQLPQEVIPTTIVGNSWRKTWTRNFNKNEHVTLKGQINNGNVVNLARCNINHDLPKGWKWRVTLRMSVDKVYVD